MHIRVFLHERGVNYDVNFLNISFGINENKIGAKQFNFIILLAKYFIFKCKYEKRDIMFESFINYLKNRIEIEQEIATNKN